MILFAENHQFLGVSPPNDDNEKWFPIFRVSFARYKTDMTALFRTGPDYGLFLLVL
jgi:hypothetical protein